MKDPLEVTESVLLIRINQSFNPGISNQELYEATRSMENRRAKGDGRIRALSRTWRRIVPEMTAPQS